MAFKRMRISSGPFQDRQTRRKVLKGLLPGSGTGTISIWTLKSGPSFTTTPALQWVGMASEGVVTAGAMIHSRSELE